MSASVKNSIFILSLLLSALYTQAVSASVASGRVSFYGSIVEPSCLVVQHGRLPVLDCSVRSDKQPGGVQNIVNTQLAYIDADKKLAVLTVTYR